MTESPGSQGKDSDRAKVDPEQYYAVVGHRAGVASRKAAECYMANHAERHAVITDLDNTVYDFPTYYEAGLEALVSRISTEFDLSVVEVVARLRQVYTHHRTIEYPFAIEEFPEVRSLPDGYRKEFVRDALTRFWVSATQKLEPYRTVRETLRHLSHEQIPVVAYTDAPVHEAMRRLRRLNIDQYFTGIVAQQWFHRKQNQILLLLNEMPGHFRPSRRMRFVWRTSWEERKPCGAVYAGISAHLGSLPQNMIVIGDSMQRDLQPAIGLGFTAVWASYGKRHIAGEDLLRQVVPDLLPEVRDETHTDLGSFHEAVQFEDILRYLPIQQLLPLG